MKNNEISLKSFRFTKNLYGIYDGAPAKTLILEQVSSRNLIVNRGELFPIHERKKNLAYQIESGGPHALRARMQFGSLSASDLELVFEPDASSVSLNLLPLLSGNVCRERVTAP